MARGQTEHIRARRFDLPRGAIGVRAGRVRARGARARAGHGRVCGGSSASDGTRPWWARGARARTSPDASFSDGDGIAGVLHKRGQRRKPAPPRTARPA